MLSGTHSHRTPAMVVTVPMFSRLVRALWFLLLGCTVISELVPLTLAFEAQFSTFAFHCYQGAKLIAFLVFGFLTPLAWWRYKSLGIGALFAIVTTAIVEAGQGFVPGHRASTLEFLVKLVLLFTAFAAGLDIRKYQEFTAGPLGIRFSSRYWSSLS
jgi:hypothetical protein